MDADLYDHLTTTITTSPDPQQHLQPSGSPVDDNAADNTLAKDPRTSSDEGPSTSPRDSPRRQRTMSSSLPDEIDQVVQAISSSQWAARLGSLVGSVKRQGESVYESTKERASRELEHVRSGIAALSSPVGSPTTEQQPRMESTDSSSSPSDSTADTPAQPALNASSLFSYFKSTADAAQKKVAPALKELSKAEDAADAYLNKWGASFSQMIKEAVAIVPPEESGLLSTRDGNVLFDGGKEKGYKSRSDKLFQELHGNRDTFIKDPPEAAFTSWKTTFSAEKHTDEIASLLDRFPSLRSTMDSLVPETVSYSDFWARCLYHKSNVDTEEAKRKQLFESNVDENEFDWGDDDEELNQQHSDQREAHTDGKSSCETVKADTRGQSEAAPRNSSTSESSNSFDIVSQSSAVPPMLDKVRQSTEDSDDDWE